MGVEDSRERLRNTSFDVIVMNGCMPGGSSAQESYEWIASNCAGMEGKLLFTFSIPVDEKTRGFLHEHGVSILSKPFEVGDLITQVRGLAQKSRRDNEGKALSAEAGI
jgi:DNA-binding response OmpR family regulator